MTRKPIFDAFRTYLGGRLNQDQVDAMEAFLDNYEKGDLKTSQVGIDLIKQFEGLRLNAYPDPGSGGAPWTVGYGATQIDGRPVRPGETITQEKADELLLHDIERHAVEVREWIKTAPTTQGQFDAMVSFHFNTGDLKRSTLLRKHMEGDYEGAANEFGRWTFASGKKLNGLVRRRAAEAELYRS